MHVLYNPGGVVKNSVIHCSRLINSAQLCYKNSCQYVDNLMLLFVYYFKNMHALVGGVDPSNFRKIFNHQCH